MKFYTGIGSRQTPPYVLDMFIELAKNYAKDGYILRSGGADGADSAFEKGAGDQKEIYLPWRGFNNNRSKLTSPTPAAFEMAKKYHPAWSRLRYPVKLLHARNCHQVLGLDLKTPSEFVVCWTIDGKAVGGTATAIKLAYDYDIQVMNYGIMNK